MTGWVFWIKLFTSRAVPGWASSVIPIYFLGGIQLLCLGVMGEYLAKGYVETKRRPRFLLSEIISQATREACDPIAAPPVDASPVT